MQDRIREIIDYSGLSASKFAEELGVQRSSISHLLAGRNKPGLDFITKILEKYPEVNTDWLVLGKGEMLSKDTDNMAVDLFSEPGKESVISEVENEQSDTIETRSTSDDHHTQVQEPELKEENQIHAQSQYSANPSFGKVVKMILCYDNGKFESYEP